MSDNEYNKEHHVKPQKIRVKPGNSNYWDWIKSNKSAQMLEAHDGTISEHPQANPDMYSDEGSYQELQQKMARIDREQDVRLRWRRRKLARLFRNGSIRRWLTLPQFKVLSMYLDNKTEQEIAMKMKITQQGVSAHLHAGLKKLQEKL